MDVRKKITVPPPLPPAKNGELQTRYAFKQSSHFKLDLMMKVQKESEAKGELKRRKLNFKLTSSDGVF